MITLFDNGTHQARTAGRLPTEVESARAWRDAELAATDYLVSASDHPKHSDILAYRQALRDWPDTESFPNDRPINPTK